jgi:hypothetical protein
VKHLQRNLFLFGLPGLVAVAVAYALLGIGFAVMVAIGLLIAGVPLLAGLVVFEEETHLPAWRRRR